MEFQKTCFPILLPKRENGRREKKKKFLDEDTNNLESLVNQDCSD